MQQTLLSTQAATYGVVPDTPRSQAAQRGAPPRFKLYKRRWLMLLLFSLHALGNNMVCYTFAPVTDLAIEYYDNSKPFPLDLLITIFFITYVMLAFPASRFVQRNGLRAGVLLGAWLQAAGALIRALDLLGDTVHSSPTDMVLLGQVVASLGQSFFVIPPPMLASTWFGDDERTLATTIACNADALGIALAYLVCPWVVTQVNHIPYLLQIIAIVTFGNACLSTLLFEDHPPIPPSYSALVRTLETERSTTVTRILTHQRDHSRSIRRQITLSRFTVIDSHFGAEGEGAEGEGEGAEGENESTNANRSEEVERSSSPVSVLTSSTPTAESDKIGSDISSQEALSNDQQLSTPKPKKKSSHQKSASTESVHLQVDEKEAASNDEQPPKSSESSSTSASSSVSAAAAASSTFSSASPDISIIVPPVLTIPSQVSEPPERVRATLHPRSIGPSKQPFTTMHSPSTSGRESVVESRRGSISGELPDDEEVEEKDDRKSAGSDSDSDDDEEEHDESELLPDNEQPPGAFWKFFREPGFTHAALAFAVGESTLNGFSTFMNSMLTPSGFSTSYVSLMGTLFVVSALVGSQIASTLVDKYKWYKPMIILSFIGAVTSIVFFNSLSHLDRPDQQVFAVTLAILLVGFFVGPLQPIAIEVATECTHPAPEADSTAILQVLANVSSAGLIPLMLLLKDPETQNMSKANWVLATGVAATGLFYLTFNGSYRRLEADREYEARKRRNTTRPAVEL